MLEDRDSGWPAPRTAYGTWIVCPRCACEEPEPFPAAERSYSDEPPRHYELHADHASVECWSTGRLQFEPRGWQLPLRSDLRAAIAGLDPRPGHCLHATYSSSAAGACDIENVLLYNVGPGTFRQLAGTALVIERATYRPRCPEALEHYARHYVAYSVTAETGFRHWHPGAQLATVGARLPALSSSTNPATVWMAAAAALDIGPGVAPAPGSPYLLDITVALPAPRPITTFIKPLLDGLISAFHAHDGSRLPEVLPRLAGTLGLVPDDAVRLLAPARPPLGTRPLLWPRGDGVQWNPADDDCVGCRISSTVDSTTYLRATLSIATPTARAPSSSGA